MVEEHDDPQVPEDGGQAAQGPEPGYHAPGNRPAEGARLGTPHEAFDAREAAGEFSPTDFLGLSAEFEDPAQWALLADRHLEEAAEGRDQSVELDLELSASKPVSTRESGRESDAWLLAEGELSGTSLSHEDHAAARGGGRGSAPPPLASEPAPAEAAGWDEEDDEQLSSRELAREFELGASRGARAFRLVALLALFGGLGFGGMQVYERYFAPGEAPPRLARTTPPSDPAPGGSTAGTPAASELAAGDPGAVDPGAGEAAIEPDPLAVELSDPAAAGEVLAQLEALLEPDPRAGLLPQTRSALELAIWFASGAHARLGIDSGPAPDAVAMVEVGPEPGAGGAPRPVLPLASQPAWLSSALEWSGVTPLDAYNGTLREDGSAPSGAPLGFVSRDGLRSHGAPRGGAPFLDPSLGDVAAATPATAEGGLEEYHWHDDADHVGAGTMLRLAEGIGRDHWLEARYPEHLLHAESRYLTPRVGPVRVHLEGGDVFEGRLSAIGLGGIWLETDLGRLRLSARRMARVQELEPGAKIASLSDPASRDLTGLPQVRVRAAGGSFIGHLLNRDGDAVTIVDAQGHRVTLESQEVEPLTQKRSVVGIKRRVH